jgi:hypothetical protein
LAAVLAAALLVVATVPYIWWRLPGAVLSLDGRRTALPVRRSVDGELLVWTGPRAPFVIDPAGADVCPVCYQPLLGDLPETNHFLIGTSFAFIMDDGYRPGVLRSYYEGDRHAVVEPGSVEFVTYAARVRVKF